MEAPNLAAVDLNLLVVFEALFIERNVSRAARRVGMTQPSMSNALARLRALIDDQLFVRTPQEMRPTPRALELAENIGRALQQIRSALKPSGTFDPASTERKFVIGAAHNIDFALAPALLALQHAAPRAEFDIIAADSFPQAISRLDAGSLDVAIGLFRAVPKRLSCISLYWEHYVCIARRENPDLAGGMTLQKFVKFPHLFITRDSGIIDNALAARGLKRRIAVQVPHFAVVPYLIEDSELLAVVGERIGRRFAEIGNVTCYAVPLDLQPWVVSAVSMRQDSPDEAIGWLLAILQQTSAALGEERSANRREAS